MSIRDAVRAIWPRLPLVATLLLVGFAYRAATRVFFLSDDFTRLLTLVNRGAGIFLLDTLSGHPQLMDNVALLVWYRLWGFRALAWALLNLATHLVNTALLFELIRKTTRSRTLAALGGAMWGTSILHVETMSWFAVYGHVMVGVVLLVVLNDVVTYSKGPGPIPTRVAVRWAFLLWLGSTCWGIGLAYAVVFPVALAVLAPRVYRQRGVQVAFGSLPFIVVGWYYASRWLRSQFGDIGFGAGSIVGQALSSLRPPRELLKHLLLVVTNVVVGNHWTPLEEYRVGVGGPAWIISLIIVAVVLVFVALDARARQLAAALALLMIGAYAVIALGRANTYAMWNASLRDAGTTSRYHYTGSMLLVVILMIGLSRAAILVRRPRALPALVLGIWASSWAYSLRVTAWVLPEREACRDTVEWRLARIDERIDSAPPGSRVYLPLAEEPLGFLCGQWNFGLWPGDAALFAIRYPTNKVRGRSVRFIAPPRREEPYPFLDPKNRRLSKLIVSDYYVSQRPGIIVPAPTR